MTRKLIATLLAAILALTSLAGCAALALGPQAERRTPIDLFDDFYQLQNDRPLSPEQRALLCGMIETIWEGQE